VAFCGAPALCRLDRGAHTLMTSNNQPRVPDTVPQPGDPGRRVGAGHGRCRRAWDRRTQRADFREP
jgi:hypothetical protein